MEASPEQVSRIARICHEVNRGYCAALGDHSQMPWEAAPGNIQESARSGVLHLMMNPEATPEEMHTVWCEYKKKDGWTYGPEKDLEQKTHPCLVDYKDLPQEQRVKDYLFSSVVRACLKEG